MLVGKSYKLNFTGPFSDIGQSEVILDAVTSARTLVDYNVDVFTSIFDNVGLSKTEYEEWLKGEKLIYTFRFNEAVYKVPSGYFEEAPEISTVDHRQAVVVIEMPYITSTELATLTNTLTDLTSFYEATMGLEVAPTVKSYGATKPIEQTLADQMQLTRITRSSDALAGRPTYSALQSKILDYQVKLEGLEAIIIDRGIID